LQAAFARAGFGVVGVFADPDGRAFEPDVSSTIWMIAQREGAPTVMHVVTRGPLDGPDRDEAVAFLRAEGYSHTISPADRVFAAWMNAEIVGAVRLAAEHGAIVLRGMRVRSDVTRRGIGRQLLDRLQKELGPATCYCIPYAWLIGFYGRIGFQVIDSANAPPFLAERHAAYRQRGLNIVIMERRG